MAWPIIELGPFQVVFVVELITPTYVYVPVLVSQADVCNLCPFLASLAPFLGVPFPVVLFLPSSASEGRCNILGQLESGSRLQLQP